MKLTNEQTTTVATTDYEYVTVSAFDAGGAALPQGDYVLISKREHADLLTARQSVEALTRERDGLASFIQTSKAFTAEYIEKLDGQGGFQIGGEAANTLVLGFVRMFIAAGGVNFVTTGAVSANGEKFEVTVQKVGGLLPHEKMSALEAENARLADFKAKAQQTLAEYCEGEEWNEQNCLGILLRMVKLAKEE